MIGKNLVNTRKRKVKLNYEPKINLIESKLHNQVMSSSKLNSFVWVGNLKESTDDKALRHHFKSFGPIRNIDIAKDKSGKLIGNFIFSLIL